MKKANWGIIGCGNIAPKHCDAIMLSGNSTLYAVCDILPERAEAIAKEYGAQKIYTDYREMLADPQVDIVSVCTPSGMHRDMCLDAMQAGKHILCEKPMEITHEKLDEVIAALEKSNVKMGCVFQRRFDKKFAAIKEAVDSGRFGKLILAEANLKYYRDQAYYNSGDWRATWELDGGGALMNQGVHGIDLLLWIAGEVESVFARCETLARDIDVEDTAIASLKFKSGAVGIIEGATSVYPGQDTKIEIHCTHGSMIVTDAGIQQWAIEGRDEPIPDISEEKFDIGSDPRRLPKTSHVPPVRDMADAVLNDHAPAIVPQQARAAVDLILAIYQSAREHREITL